MRCHDSAYIPVTGGIVSLRAAGWRPGPRSWGVTESLRVCSGAAAVKEQKVTSGFLTLPRSDRVDLTQPRRGNPQP